MNPIKSPIYQTQQIRELEKLACERFGLNGQLLMERAGKAAFEYLLRRWPQVQVMTVLCGTGNNGGDGYALAHLAHERGLKVTVLQVGDPDKIKGEAKEALDSCKQANVPIYPFSDNIDLQRPDLIVDAICGIGLHAPLHSEALAAVLKMQRTRAPIFALDLPTGVDADTGVLLGAAVPATATMTFIGLKLGLLTGAGVAYTGELVSNDLHLPPELFTYVDPVLEKIQSSDCAPYLKPRSKDWHKGLSGHVLILGGETGFAGAPRMAALAALRVGAGLVSIATHPDHAAFLNMNCPEVMCHGVKEIDQLAALIEKADVMVIGPGLGQSEWSKKCWSFACQSDLPLIVDADGLNLLSQQPQHNGNWILTPHPGEAGRLLGQSAQEIQQNRFSAIQAIHQRYGGVCVLKGAGSLVYTSHGLPVLCDKGNPGMASAGMGDVLSGVIGGLLAQNIPLFDAAKIGVYLHAMAGDAAAKDGERGMIATDLMPFLRRLVNYSTPL